MSCSVSTISPASLLIGLLISSSAGHGSPDSCCPVKTVGHKTYSFLRYEPGVAAEYDCLDNCVYRDDGGENDLTCFRKGGLNAFCNGGIGPLCEDLHDLPEKTPEECNRVCKDPKIRANRFNCVFKRFTKDLLLPQHCPEADPANCIGDGGPSRRVTVITDNSSETYPRIPGPPIVVCKGDIVTVNLTNQGALTTTTIHWHGLRMRAYNKNYRNQRGVRTHNNDYAKGNNEDFEGEATPWSDGTPYVTQCPVLPGDSFQYIFYGIPTGTYWYHSHALFQRVDGAYGPLIIKDFLEEPKAVKDFPENTMMFSDWYDEPALDGYLKCPRHCHPTSILVEGRGYTNQGPTQAMDHTGMGRSSDGTPIQPKSYHVDPDQMYRFRLISATGEDCYMTFSIEDHKMTVVAADGENVEPFGDVGQITFFNSERFDILINTTGKDPNKSYVMKIEGDNSCKGLTGYALLQYPGSPNQLAFNSSLTNFTSPGKHLNHKNTAKEEGDKFPITSLKSSDCGQYENETCNYTGQTVNKTFYIQTTGTPYTGPNFNNISFRLTSLTTNLLSQENDINKELICNRTNYEAHCDDKGLCLCYHILYVDLNDVVEIFYLGNHVPTHLHPIHLHGYWFNVVNITKFATPEENTIENVKKMNEENKIIKNLINPVRKDVIPTLTNGFVVIRFKANNPGYWLVHCHIDSHVADGMTFVIKVGQRKDWHIPKGFPKCGDFKPCH